MAIVINGSGTVTGISVGGLPDGIVDAGTLATNSVDSAELIDGSVDNSHIDAMAASKLTGALPSLDADTLFPFTSSAQNFGKMRIITGTVTTGATETVWGGGGSSGATYYILVTVTYTGFSGTPRIFAMTGASGSHQSNVGSYYQTSSTSSNFYITSGATGQIEEEPVYYLVIGTAS